MILRRNDTSSKEWLYWNQWIKTQLPRKFIMQKRDRKLFRIHLWFQVGCAVARFPLFLKRHVVKTLTQRFAKPLAKSWQSLGVNWAAAFKCVRKSGTGPIGFFLKCWTHSYAIHRQGVSAVGTFLMGLAPHAWRLIMRLLVHIVCLCARIVVNLRS